MSQPPTTCDQIAARAEEFNVASRCGYGHHVGTGFNAVGQHSMAGAVQALHTFNAQGSRPEAFDLGAHRQQAVGKVGDFRL